MTGRLILLFRVLRYYLYWFAVLFNFTVVGLFLNTGLLNAQRVSQARRYSISVIKKSVILKFIFCFLPLQKSGEK
jgi:hypothetical protein